MALVSQIIGNRFWLIIIPEGLNKINTCSGASELYGLRKAEVTKRKLANIFLFYHASWMTNGSSVGWLSCVAHCIYSSCIHVHEALPGGYLLQTNFRGCWLFTWAHREIVAMHILCNFYQFLRPVKHFFPFTLIVLQCCCSQHSHSLASQAPYKLWCPVACMWQWIHDCELFCREDCLLWLNENKTYHFKDVFQKFAVKACWFLHVSTVSEMCVDPVPL